MTSWLAGSQVRGDQTRGNLRCLNHCISWTRNASSDVAYAALRPLPPGKLSEKDNVSSPYEQIDKPRTVHGTCTRLRFSDLLRLPGLRIVYHADCDSWNETRLRPSIAELLTHITSSSLQQGRLRPSDCLLRFSCLRPKHTRFSGASQEPCRGQTGPHHRWWTESFTRQRSPWTAPRDRKRTKGGPDPSLPRLEESSSSSEGVHLLGSVMQGICWACTDATLLVSSLQLDVVACLVLQPVSTLSLFTELKSIQLAPGMHTRQQR